MEVAQEARVRGYRGKRGREPTAWSIQKILTRPVYCGYYSYKGNLYKGDFAPIIDVQTFNKVQTLLRRQGKKSSQNNKQKIKEG